MYRSIVSYRTLLLGLLSVLCATDHGGEITLIMELNNYNSFVINVQGNVRSTSLSFTKRAKLTPITQGSAGA
jgi:hypothetical protein